MKTSKVLLIGVLTLIVSAKPSFADTTDNDATVKVTVATDNSTYQVSADNKQICTLAKSKIGNKKQEFVCNSVYQLTAVIKSPWVGLDYYYVGVHEKGNDEILSYATIDIPGTSREFKSPKYDNWQN